jgi:hypothetical protein
MATEDFLNSFLNTYVSKNFSPSVERGQFSIINRTSASVDYPGGNQLSDLRLRTDFQCIGKQKTLQMDDTFNDYNGFNKEYISEQGVFVVEAALRQFARTDFGRRVVAKDIEAHIRSLTHRDCHTSYLYNMLITWGKALLYKMNGDTDDILRVQCSPYRSEHVTIGLPDLHDRVYEIPIETPYDGQAAPQTRRTDTNYFLRPYVLHYNASTAEQEWFYLLHVPTRNSTSALNFDFAVPGINNGDTIILDPIDPHGPEVDADAAENVPWHDPDTQWKWILDYVSLNRLEQQFASTLELFGAMFFHPLWSSAEACQWQMSELVAVLGTFEPTRARLRTSLEGTPYSTDPDANVYVIKSQIKPISYLINSALLNYYMWYGLYTAIYNDAVDRDEWRTALTSVNGELQMLYTPHMRAFVIGILLNQEVPTNMMHGAGFYVSMDGVEKVHRISHTAPGTSGEQAEVIVEALYAPVSGSLVLGTMSGDLETVQHLKSKYRVDFRGTRTEVYDKVELLKIANIYRLFGHQITLFDIITQEKINPWAAVNECIIEPSSIAFDPKEVKKLTLGWSDAREGRVVPLPALGSLGVEGFLDITIQKPHLETIKFRTAQESVKVYVTAKRSKKPLAIKVKSGYSYRPETFQAKKGISYRQKDFHDAPRQPPPDNPEGEIVKEPEQTTVLMESDTQSVKIAESNTNIGKSHATPGTSLLEERPNVQTSEKTITFAEPIKIEPLKPVVGKTILQDSGGTISSQH